MTRKHKSEAYPDCKPRVRHAATSSTFYNFFCAPAVASTPWFGNGSKQTISISGFPPTCQT
eukprot:jgi/Botrbrau1/18436/Bobra.0072s0024.1